MCSSELTKHQRSEDAWKLRKWKKDLAWEIDKEIERLKVMRARVLDEINQLETDIIAWSQEDTDSERLSR